MKTTEKHIEFSKIMVIAAFVITIFILLFVVCLMWETGDTSGIEYIIPSVFAFLAFTARQYYIKAGQENQIKLKAQHGDNYISPKEVLGDDEVVGG